jgi:hypothetical protein
LKGATLKHRKYIRECQKKEKEKKKETPKKRNTKTPTTEP